MIIKTQIGLGKHGLLATIGVLTHNAPESYKFTNFRYRRRSLFKSISVAVGVAIGLHHQYCDHLFEIQQKMLSGMQH